MFVGGMAYEAMNHAGWLKLRKFLVILNDNGQVSLPTAYNEVHTPVRGRGCTRSTKCVGGKNEIDFFHRNQGEFTQLVCRNSVHF